MGVQADEKIASEIKLVLKTYNAGGAVIVSDGEDDESVIPAIQNILPVVSVQRVVMKRYCRHVLLDTGTRYSPHM